MSREYLNILDKLKYKSQKSLSDENLAWICRMIERFKPKRILEIGVSTGGSTAVYLNCIKKLGLKTELVSIDSETVAFYKKGKPDIGSEVYDLSHYLDLTNFKLIRGKYIADVVNDIGVFDMIIMDTVHFIPGEILDLLCLKNNIDKDTIIILDDINIESRYPELYAQNLNSTSSNAILLSSLNGRLIFPNTVFPEIGGIILEDSTFDENRILLCLCHKWNSDILESKNRYFNKIKELYGTKFLDRLNVIYDKYKYSNFNSREVK